MKRFHFSLKPVAIMRAHRELSAREALAASLAALGQTEARLAAARARIADLEAVIRSSRSGSFRPTDGVAFGQAYRREWGAEAEAQKQVATARSAMEKRREACIEANRNLKVITQLEEKARAIYRQERQRAEQGEIDELAGRSASRRRHLSS
jgi:flagellar FliJ protein